MAPQPFQVGDGDAGVCDLSQDRNLQPPQRRVAALERHARDVGSFFLRHLKVRVAARVQPGVEQASDRAGHLAVGIERMVVRKVAQKPVHALVDLAQQKVVKAAPRGV